MCQISVEVKWKDEIMRLELGPGATPSDAIKELGLNLSTKIVMKSGAPIPVDDTLADGDSIWIIETVSGG